MPMKDVEDMTWAEFQLRSFGFWEDRKFQMYMTREISYEVHGLNYMLSKKSRPKKEAYWPIGKGKVKTISDKAKKAFLQARQEYLEKKKNG